MDSERPQEEREVPSATPASLFRWRWVILVALLGGLTYAAFYLPLPFFYAFLPGPVRDVERLVEISDARTYSSEGSLYLTTVSVDTQVTLVDWVESLFDESRMIVSREQVTQGASFEELEDQQKLEMERSKQQAIEVALVALGYKPPMGDGVKVLQVAKESPAEGVLRANDVIIAVDGEPVATHCDASGAISSHEPGDRLSITLQREGERRQVSVEAAAFPGDPEKAYVGVLMRTLDYRFDPGLEVKFNTHRIAGPSGGLMFSLALYDRLTPEDLTHGQKIAGTGTIGCGGEVGPIGGIQQKIAAAQEKGVEIFLAPADNAAEARAVADDIDIVPIETFDDALTYLEDL